MQKQNIKHRSARFARTEDILSETTCIIQDCEILKINRKTAYKLFENNQLSCVRIGRKYRIAKIDLIKYLLGN